MSIKKFKDFINSINNGNDTGESKAEVGFKILFSEENYQLIIKIIGARNLPSSFGNIKTQGYVVKVKVFPLRDKYETQIIKECNPICNQEFNFDVRSYPQKTNEDPFTGKFVVFTVYAILENENKKEKLYKSESFSRQLKTFVGLKDQYEFRRDSKVRNSNNRISFSNRRTVGAVTYNLDRKLFTQKIRHNYIATLDIWRAIEDISSGIQSPAKEANKGTLELTLTYSNSEDGNNDMVEVNLSRLRCSMQVMQEHEKYGGSLYIKMTAYEYDVLISSWKSDRFDATISMKIEPTTATLQANFKNYNVDNVKIIIRLICKNLLGKKILLGKINICNTSSIWKQITENPGTPVTQMYDFE